LNFYYLKVSLFKDGTHDDYMFLSLIPDKNKIDLPIQIRLDYYTERYSSGKSKHSDWLFPGQDFAIQTISVETVISPFLLYGL